MIHIPAIHNKAQHVVNKIKAHCNCHADIWVATNDSLADSEFEHLIDEKDEVMHAFEIAIEGKVTPYMEKEVKRLNRWLAKYNAKHGTKFSCIAIFNNL
jgi:hypothetical protein